MKTIRFILASLCVLTLVSCAGVPAPVEEKKPAEEAKPKEEKIKRVSVGDKLKDYKAKASGKPQDSTGPMLPGADKGALDADSSVGSESQKPVVKVVKPTPEQLWAELTKDVEDRKYDKALPKIVYYRKEVPADTKAELLELKVRYFMDDYAVGYPMMAERIGKGEEDPEIINTFVRWSIKGGKVAEATEVFKALVDNESQNPDVISALGWLYDYQGKKAEAMAELEKIAFAPQGKKFAMMLARLRFELGNTPGAQKIIDSPALSKTLEGLVLRGDINRSEGRSAQAEAAYNEALKLEPGNYMASVNLGILKLGSGDAKGAKELLAGIAQKSPERPEAWNNLGLAQRTLGDFDQARASYEKALKADSSHAPALKNMGILLEKYFARMDEALPYYEKYLALNPSDEEVGRWVKSATRQKGGQ